MYSGDGCDLALTLCKYDLRKVDLFVLSWARVRRVRRGSISCCFAFRDLWKEWGDSNFQNFSQNCQFHHRRLESLEHFNVLLYIILSTTVSFLSVPSICLFVFLYVGSYLLI